MNLNFCLYFCSYLIKPSWNFVTSQKGEYLRLTSPLVENWILIISDLNYVILNFSYVDKTSFTYTDKNLGSACCITCKLGLGFLCEFIGLGFLCEFMLFCGWCFIFFSGNSRVSYKSEKKKVSKWFIACRMCPVKMLECVLVKMHGKYFRHQVVACKVWNEYKQKG